MKNKIKVLRAEKKLTQSQLAEMAGIARPTLAMIENEKAIPDGNTIAALVRALEVPANEIFFDLGVVNKQRDSE